MEGRREGGNRKKTWKYGAKKEGMRYRKKEGRMKERGGRKEG